MPPAILDVEIDQPGLNETAPDPLVAEFPGRQIQLLEFAEQARLVQPGVQQRTQHHVSAGACLAVEIGRRHAGKRSVRRAISVACTPAPNPLSMFTTETPGAQLVNIPSRAARPPNAAP